MKEKASIKISSKQIFAIAVPLILQQLSLQIQIYVDRAMLGHANSEYFSAVGNVLAPYYAVTSIICAICAGTTILIAQSIGAKNLSRCKRYAECSFIGNSLFPVIFFVFFFFGSRYMFHLMGVQSPVLEYSISYIKTLSFSLLVIGLVSTATSVMQGIGITKIIMYTGIISNVINLILDWILIYGRFGFPQMNIEGAALATTIANYATAPIIIIYIFVSKKIPFRLSLRGLFDFRWNIYKQVLKVGVPSGMEYALWNIGNLIVVSLLNRLDSISTGIYTLIFSLETFPFLLYMGFANAALTLVGHKTGENEHAQAIEVGFRCMRFSLVICVAVAVLFCVFPKEILSIFTNDKALVSYAAPFLIIVSFTMFPKSINNVIGLGIRGMGDTKWMLYGQIFGTIFVITLSYLLIFVVGLGLLGIFITFLADELIRSMINMLRFWRGREFFFIKPSKKLQ